MPQPRIAAVGPIGLTFLPDRFKDVDLTLSPFLWRSSVHLPVVPSYTDQKAKRIRLSKKF